MKKTISQTCTCGLVAAWTAVAIVSPAHAYIDPGSGSMIITAILGAIGAAGYAIRFYYSKFKEKIKALFGKQPGK